MSDSKRAIPRIWHPGDDTRIRGAVIIGRAVWNVPSNPPSEFHGLIVRAPSDAELMLKRRRDVDGDAAGEVLAVFYDRAAGCFMTLPVDTYPSDHVAIVKG